MADEDVYGEQPGAIEIAALVAVLALSVGRFVANRARRTVVENAQKDPAKPKCRWVVEPDACDFCKKRGSITYEPNKTPTNSHSACKCHPDTIYDNAETDEERYRRRIDNAKVVHENFYDATSEEVAAERRRLDADLRAKWAEYKALAKQDGISPKVAYDRTVGSYFSSLSEPGRMSVDSFVDLKNNKGHEAQLSKWFADAGHTVRLRMSNAGGNTSDAFIDGATWEFKRITSKHRNKIVQRVTEHIPRQGPRFVVDLSESSITRSDAERVIAELLDEDGVDEIMLVMDGNVKLFTK